MTAKSQITVKIPVNYLIQVDIPQADIDRASRAIWGMAPDEYLAEYAIDALLQTGIATDDHPVTDSEWQKDFERNINLHNLTCSPDNVYPTYASSRLLDAVRWEFHPETQKLRHQAAQEGEHTVVEHAFTANQSAHWPAHAASSIASGMHTINDIVHQATWRDNLAQNSNLDCYEKVRGSMGKIRFALDEQQFFMRNIQKQDPESADFRDTLEQVQRSIASLDSNIKFVCPIIEEHLRSIQNQNNGASADSVEFLRFTEGVAAILESAYPVLQFTYDSLRALPTPVNHKSGGILLDITVGSFSVSEFAEESGLALMDGVAAIRCSDESGTSVPNTVRSSPVRLK